MNFTHLLGRAPDGFADMRAHNATMLNEGYDAEIDSYLDSEEYDNVFGEDTVPFLRFCGAYTPCDSFNKQYALKGCWANSNKAMGRAALNGYISSDGRQMSTLILTHIASVPVDHFAVAASTPLKSTEPNWYAALMKPRRSNYRNVLQPYRRSTKRNWSLRTTPEKIRSPYSAR